MFLRFRGVWPADGSPILDATADCVMRLLCCSVFDGYANGQIAFDIERKIKTATVAHMARLRPVLEYEAEIAAYQMIAKAGDPTLRNLLTSREECLRVALEGDLIELAPHEARLLKAAVDICHLPEKFADPNKTIRGHLSRWYAPILAVLAGKNTESHEPAQPLPSVESVPNVTVSANELIEA